MGQSTDAQICLGFSVGDEGDELSDVFPNLALEGDDESDFEEAIALAGGMEPWTSAEDGRAPDYYERKRAIIDACPVELIMHCSGDYPMWILSLRGSFVRACRGQVVDIDLPRMEESDVAKFKEWCASNGVEWKEPKWLLTSLWF